MKQTENEPDTFGGSNASDSTDANLELIEGKNLKNNRMHKLETYQGMARDLSFIQSTENRYMIVRNGMDFIIRNCNSTSKLQKQTPK